MALTNAGINQIRNSMNTMAREWDNVFGSHTPFYLNQMCDDPDFNLFIAGTKFGQVNYEKWKKLVDLLMKDFHLTLSEIQTATNIYLNRQESLNNLKQTKLNEFKPNAMGEGVE